jgi:methionyl-tRNA synthetase
MLTCDGKSSSGANGDFTVSRLLSIVNEVLKEGNWVDATQECVAGIQSWVGCSGKEEQEKLKSKDATMLSVRENIAAVSHSYFMAMTYAAKLEQLRRLAAVVVVVAIMIVGASPAIRASA